MSKKETTAASGVFEIDTLNVRVHWSTTKGVRRYWVENGEGKRMAKDDMDEDWLRSFLAALGREVIDREVTDRLNQVNEAGDDNRK